MGISMRKRFSWQLVMAVVALLVLAACGGAEPPIEPAVAPPVEETSRPEPPAPPTPPAPVTYSV